VRDTERNSQSFEYINQDHGIKPAADSDEKPFSVADESMRIDIPPGGFDDHSGCLPYGN
jgi:hypothetical protein